MAFLHVPKTGGTSVIAYLKRNLEIWCDELHIMPFMSVADAVKLGSASPQLRRPHDVAPLGNCTFGHLRAGPRGDARPAYVGLVLAEGFKLQHVLGHLPFGWCRMLDAGCTYVTLMREPVQRLASHWGYLRHTHPQLLVTACGQACQTLGGFATELAAGTAQAVLGGLDNMQTRMLAGDGFLASMTGRKVCPFHTPGCDTAAPMEADRAMLDLAKNNLVRYYKVVGLLEDLPGFTADMEAAFCFKQRDVGGLNRLGTGRSVMKDNVDPGVLAMLRSTQALDLELYAFAQQLIAARRAAAAKRG